LGLNRRKFAAGIGSVAAWPFAARAQQAERVRRLGVLLGFPVKDREGELRVSAFRNALAQAGWIEGRNLVIEERWAGDDKESIAALAKELVTLKLDAIVGHNTPQVAALLGETSSIPIVFTSITNPVGSQFVDSFRPSGNATGFMNSESTLGGKWLQILKEIAPGISKITLIFDPDVAPFGLDFLQSAQAAGSPLSVKTNLEPIRDRQDMEKVIAAVGSERNTGLIVVPDTFTSAHRTDILALVKLHSVPAIYGYRYFVADGGLVSYGVDVIDLFKRAAGYVDRIFRGATINELPVQRPSKFELVINLKTAKTLGLTLPPTLLATADEVIE
jgi:putative tryptophan/tyrosine transport system substrate-binding protein